MSGNLKHIKKTHQKTFQTCIRGYDNPFYLFPHTNKIEMMSYIRDGIFFFRSKKKGKKKKILFHQKSVLYKRI